MKPLLLDLYCKQGGAAKGYADAGFEVIGVDIEPQPHYPYEFIRGDVMELLRNFEIGSRLQAFCRDVDAIHASPPCQLYTNAHKIRGNRHPDLIDPTRKYLMWIGKPYVIENVPGAPLIDPVELCGAMFGLKTYRHRLFEANGFTLTVPGHPEHEVRTTKMGRVPKDGEFMHVVGNFSGVAKAKEAMGIDWMTREGLREAIPPAYTEHIGRQLVEQI